MNKGLLDQLAVQSFILLGYFWKKTNYLLCLAALQSMS